MAEFTGERVIPTEVDPNLLNEHMARYAFAARLTKQKRVLDAGCGTGYGSAELAWNAHDVLAIDVSGEAVEFARRNYGTENLRFAQASCTAIPAPAESFDIVAAFEIIEHLKDWRVFLREVRRVLAPGGLFLVSTPNRRYYAEARREEGPNPFHEHEFELEEFRHELAVFFPNVSLYFENHTGAILLEPEHPAAATVAEFEYRTDTGGDTHFFVAICGFERVPEIPALIYVPRSGNVLREREEHIHLLESEIATKNGWIGDRDTRIVQLQDELATAQARARERIDQLEQESANNLAAAQRLVKELKDKCDELERCVGLLSAAERTVAERTELAQQAQAQAAELRGRILGSGWFRLGRKLGLGPSLDPPK